MFYFPYDTVCRWRMDTLKLPKTTVALANGDIEDIATTLADELTPQAADLVNEACDSGGAPDDEQIGIDSLKIGDDALIAHVTIYFTELVPSSCEEHPHRERRQHRLVVTLPRGDSTGIVGDSSSDPNQWDLIDRNSAADGT